jgi:hypothetical protein
MDKEIPVHMAASTGRDDQWTIKDQEAGGNISGYDPDADIYMVPDFQGASGQGANQSTDRPKGSG